ncbi:hypothetical protein [Bacillus sp. T3]|uniref:hypothetical protein n=1 Tax=Bacillus sp. T3 TaxID=467262 RepID=UPI002980FD53|nr:hypothetical protein [Bacillus sp. T3]
MLQRNNGYFLAELLLSLATWLLLTGFMLPMVMLVWGQSAQLQLENTATHLLYDALERHVVEGVSTEGQLVHLNGTVYEIRWSGETSDIKVCVEYDYGQSVPKQICKKPER